MDSRPNSDLIRSITQSEIASFVSDGVVHLPGILDIDWIHFLRTALEEVIDDPNNFSTQSGIIVAGSYSTDGNEKGAYWTDYDNDGSWERTDLDDARVIHDIAVNNGVLFAVGETTWARGEQDPAIWIDGIKTEVTLMRRE